MHHCVIALRIILFYEVFFIITLLNALQTANADKTDDGTTPITDNDWLNNIVPNNYDKTTSPARFKNDTLSGITVSIVPISISDISEMNMQFEVDLLFTVVWKEPRLPFDDLRKRTSLSYVSLPRKFLDHVWIPYLRINNCVYCEDQRQIVHSGIEHLDVWLNMTGESLLLSYRQTFKFSCHFDLHKYPLDTHECSIFIYTIVLPSEHGYVFLKIEPVRNISVAQYVQKYIPAQYHLSNVVLLNECSGLNPFEINKPNNECIRVSFSFDRLIYYELMLLYLPSTFIVIVSWLSFWMDVEASGPRVALGLTSLLTLSTQFANAQKNLPPVSYVKAIDVWMLNCSFMVFISLIEYFLSYQLRKWRKDESIENERSLSTGNPVFKKNHVKVGKLKRNAKETGKSTTKIDFFARIIFPISFLVFNLAYWIYYAY